MGGGGGGFRGVRHLGRGSGLGGVGRSFGVGLWVGLGGVVGCGLGVVDPGFFSLWLRLLSCSPLFFFPSASTFLTAQQLTTGSFKERLRTGQVQGQSHDRRLRAKSK